MDFYVCMGRRGERVAKRRVRNLVLVVERTIANSRQRARSTVGASHRIRKDEIVRWYKQRFEGIVR